MSSQQRPENRKIGAISFVKKKKLEANSRDPWYLELHVTHQNHTGRPIQNKVLVGSIKNIPTFLQKLYMQHFSSL